MENNSIKKDDFIDGQEAHHNGVFYQDTIPFPFYFPQFRVYKKEEK